MTAAALIRQAQESGVVLRLDGGKVKASGPVEAVTRMLGPLRQHRAELENALREPTTTPATGPEHRTNHYKKNVVTAPPTESNPHVQRLQALGLEPDEAQATAALVRAYQQARRWDFDDRVMCWHCAALRQGGTAWVCGNWRAAGLGGAALGRDLMNLPQRCGGYVGIQMVKKEGST